MVSSGTVSSDMSTFDTNMVNYKNYVADLTGQWKGDSYNNLVTKTNEFISEFQSAIDKQMTSFASACQSYEEYVNTKRALSDAQSAYNEASANKDHGSMSYYASLISQYEAALQRLKGEIEAALADASSPTLTATSASASSSYGSPSSTAFTSGIFSPNAMVQKVMDIAFGLAADNTHGYSQDARRRWGSPDFDCSSFVITCWEMAGVPVKEAGAGYTGSMKQAFLSTGLFEWIPGPFTTNDLQPGDVLLNENSHTELYIGNGQMIGARHGDADGVPGDSSGNEISVTGYDRQWQGVLRYIGPSNYNGDDDDDDNHQVNV